MGGATFRKPRRFRFWLKALIGLLVVVFLAFLSARVTTNVAWRLSRSHYVRALAEINTLETAMLQVQSAAEVRDVRKLFFPEEFRRVCDAYALQHSVGTLQASIEIYSTAFRAIFAYGRNAAITLKKNGEESIASTLNERCIEKLGTQYCSVSNDPWGNPYYFFPGPWTEVLGQIPFRIYLDRSNVSADEQSVKIADGVLQDRVRTGLLAPEDKTIYIWSCGPDGRCDQAYCEEWESTDATNRQSASDNSGHADGGDDINNWDTRQSWSVAHEAKPRLQRIRESF